ncbi:putative mitochondrial hypothetical protein [Leptomonas pyrrhocoris]|uniref:PH domain-containing protein n=1 Tax=Leptomonas pyrrhocoris TaxID=157538 RepID=A0A0N0VF87_LEPPY|nr:putative mitochondrial hypothetical protein [Leptomonas pyrrhocoris]KPA79982.1 putative mitochondrial hypothetical protein [Leptomonas pyrrhocoris]|eukprot:XP_015658421.1 putative mitochondrial hypothetical protein [Leptomonas pyrrhocoris]
MVAAVRAALLALAVVICYLDHIALRAEARYAISQSSVSIVTGILPEAKVFARDRQRAGEWHFDFTSTADEEIFFEAENKATQQWREWKRRVRSLRAYRQQQQQQDATNARDAADDDNPAGDHTRGTDRHSSALANYFTERQVQKRFQARIKKQGGFNTSTAEGLEEASSEVRRDIASLWDRLQAAGASSAPTDQAYLGLVERHFPHTYVRKWDHTAADSPFPSLTLLHTPFLLEAEVLPHVEKEVEHLRELWRLRRDAAVSTTAEVDAQLSEMADLVESSRACCTQVVSLVAPLAEAASRLVASNLVATRDAISANDEATEAKRAELKQLHRQRSSLQKAKQALDRHLGVYTGVLRRHQLPNAEAVLFALELLAKQRFGDDVQGVIEAVPILSTTAPFTGLLEEEWTTHVLRPFCVCVLITAAFLWIAEEVKEWCLRRVQASKARLVAGIRSPRGAATTGTGRFRKLFLLACLLEALMPPLLPALVFAVHLRSAADWSMAVVKVMRPSQRVVCVVALLGLTVLNYVCGVLVRRLFLLIDPSVYRRRHAKMK